MEVVGAGVETTGLFLVSVGNFGGIFVTLNPGTADDEAIDADDDDATAAAAAPALPFTTLMILGGFCPPMVSLTMR